MEMSFNVLIKGRIVPYPSLDDAMGAEGAKIIFRIGGPNNLKQVWVRYAPPKEGWHRVAGPGANLLRDQIINMQILKDLHIDEVCGEAVATAENTPDIPVGPELTGESPQHDPFNGEDPFWYDYQM